MPENTSPAAPPVNPVAEVSKAIDGLKADLDTKYVTREQADTLNKTLNDLKQEVKELRNSGATGAVRVYERFQDDPQKGYTSFGHFLTNVAAVGENQPQDEKLKHLSFTKAPTGASVAEGPSLGYSIPPGFLNTIWDGMNQSVDSLIGRTSQFTVEGESLEFPANAETSRATGSRWGGVNGYWIAEADTITSSKPKLRKVKLEPQELAALVYLTDKLIARSPMAVEQYCSRAATEELMFLSNNAIVSGTGAGQPLGVLNAGCVVEVAKETGQAAATIVAANIDKMFARLHPRSRGKAIWLHSVDIQPQLDVLSQAVGTGGVALYRPPTGLAGAPLATLKGIPMLATEYNPTLGTVGDLMLVDLSAYATGFWPGGIKTASSIHVQFLTAQTAFRFMYAIDGQPLLASAITPFNGGPTLSPFVTLATRA
jgi:HK97 family phage major capsid protein